MKKIKQINKNQWKTLKTRLNPTTMKAEVILLTSRLMKYPSSAHGAEKTGKIAVKEGNCLTYPSLHKCVGTCKHQTVLQ